MLSKQLLMRFVKDYSIPINIFDEKYFNYFLDLYDPLYGCKKLYRDFCNYVDLFEDEDAFFKNQSELITEISLHIVENEKYKNFTSFDTSIYKPLVDVSQKNIYNHLNVDKFLFSIDLKKANFASLKYFDKSLVNNYETYEDFIKQYNDHDYIINSKNLRQVIFGQLNVKRQQIIQKYIISIFAEELIKVISKERIISASSDEIVIDIDDIFNIELVKQLTNIVNNKASLLDVNVNVSCFKLKELSNPKYGFVKEHLNDKIEFKACNKLFFARAYKEYFNLPLHDYDFLFYHEGELAKFIKEC